MLIIQPLGPSARAQVQGQLVYQVRLNLKKKKKNRKTANVGEELTWSRHVLQHNCFKEQFLLGWLVGWGTFYLVWVLFVLNVESVSNEAQAGLQRMNNRIS